MIRAACVASIALAVCGCREHTDVPPARALAADVPAALPAVSDDDVPPEPTPAVPADEAFASDAPVPVRHAVYTVIFPDERDPGPVTHRIVIDDEGDRLHLAFDGAPLPIASGIGLAARSGASEFLFESTDGARDRPATADEVARWFHQVDVHGALLFHRSDQTVSASRGGLSAVLYGERSAERHPLVCRALLALLLGGDAVETRVACANATLPVRATLHSHGWAALVFERTSVSTEPRARREMAVPRAGARHDLEPVPAAPTFGAWIAGEPPDAGTAVTMTNAFDRTVIVLVDDRAVAWIAPGETRALLVPPGSHRIVRARTIDGLERSRAIDYETRHAVRLEPAPQIEE